MNTCKTCKHWGDYNPMAPENWRECNAQRWEGDSYFHSIHNCSEGDTWFVTGPDFGCVHWTCPHVFDIAVCAFGVWYRKCSKCEHMEPLKDVAMA